MRVNPGELDKRIRIIQRKAEGQDSAGFDVEEVETVIRECWAKVTNTSGKELMEGGKEFSEAKKRFLVRYTQVPISTDMILQYRGHEYDIQYINTYNDDKDYLEIWTEGRASP